MVTLYLRIVTLRQFPHNFPLNFNREKVKWMYEGDIPRIVKHGFKNGRILKLRELNSIFIKILFNLSALKIISNSKVKMVKLSL